MRTCGAYRRARGCMRPSAPRSCPRPRASVPAGSWRCLDPRRLDERFLHLPALPLGEGAMLDDAHAVADGACVGLVVRQKARVRANVLLVPLVLDEPLHPHHHGLVHLVADHHTFDGAALSTLAHRVAPRVFRSTVSTRAMSRRSEPSL